MKKVFMLLACLSVFAFSAQAQKACAKKSKACCASKMAKAQENADISMDAVAVAKAAALDDSIERKVCDKSGKVSYHQKAVCPASGKVSMKEVQYDAATAKFVNISPSDMTEAKMGKKACTPAEMKACKKVCTPEEMKACKAKKAAKEAGLKTKATRVKVSAVGSGQ